MLEARLPEPRAISRFGKINGFIRFGPDWAPEFLPMRGPILRANGFKPLRRRFQYGLRRVFEELDVPWNPPRVSWAASIFLVLLCVVVFGLPFLSFLLP